MSEPSSVLICRLSALGDIVLTLPVIDALREAYPGARLEYLAREPHGRVLRDVRKLDALHLWAGPGSPVPQEAAERAWDVVVDLSRTGRSRRLLRRVRGRRRLAARKETMRRFAFVRLRRLGGDRPKISRAVDRMFAALSPLGLRRGNRVPRFEVPEPPADGPVLLAPGGGRDSKRWPADRFAELARRLTDAGVGVRLVGSETERALLEGIARAAGSPPGRLEVIAGPDPADLPAIAAASPVAVTNDSGLLHVAEASGSVVIALFGPTHPRLGFAPIGPFSRVVQTSEPCRPCDPHGPARCPLGHHRCLTTIPVDRVLEAVESVRAEIGGGP